ncbi:hypothetical protein JOF35_004097 [Streptomyces demainii]|uniref:Uncharacterized protein n=1 Tax=Streptomyces demainii TaxID=588122 RepID=A0ABT9KTP6_9ACTN|nr:hypothetical protein [Streptomyces demainii]
MRPGGFNAETRVSRAPPTQLIRTRTIWFWQEVQPNFFLLGPGPGVAPTAGAPLLTSCFTRVVGCLSRSSVDGRIVAAAGGESCAESSYVLGWFLSASGPRALGCLAMAGYQWHAASRRAPMVNVRFPRRAVVAAHAARSSRGAGAIPGAVVRPRGTARPGRRWAPRLPPAQRSRSPHGTGALSGRGAAVLRGHGAAVLRGHEAAGPRGHGAAGRRGRSAAGAGPADEAPVRRSAGPRWCASASCRCDAGWQRGAGRAGGGGRGSGRWCWTSCPWSDRGAASADTAPLRLPRHRACRVTASPRCPRVNG